MKLVAADVRRLHLEKQKAESRKTEIDQSFLTSAATKREGKLKETTGFWR